LFNIKILKEDNNEFKKFTVIFLVLSLAMLFGKIPTEFDSGSPKTWSYDKIQNYYIYKKIFRNAE